MGLNAIILMDMIRLIKIIVIVIVWVILFISVRIYNLVLYLCYYQFNRDKIQNTHAIHINVDKFPYIKIK